MLHYVFFELSRGCAAQMSERQKSLIHIRNIVGISLWCPYISHSILNYNYFCVHFIRLWVFRVQGFYQSSLHPLMCKYIPMCKFIIIQWLPNKSLLGKNITLHNMSPIYLNSSLISWYSLIHQLCSGRFQSRGVKGTRETISSHLQIFYISKL